MKEFLIALLDLFDEWDTDELCEADPKLNELLEDLHAVVVKHVWPDGVE